MEARLVVDDLNLLTAAVSLRDNAAASRLLTVCSCRKGTTEHFHLKILLSYILPAV